MAIRELLKGKMSKNELKLVPSSFDILGNRDKAVAIIELDDKIKKRSKMIANALMKQHKNVSSVLLKASPRKGIARIREYKLIAGDKNTEVIHAENGCRFVVDPVKAYFSQREGTERQRIIKKVCEGEKVMVFFAGIGPFAIEIAKKTKAKHVTGIEINPSAVEYFRKNIELNKTKNVDVMEGDVADYIDKYSGYANRLLMPLPEKSIEYLDAAIKCTKHGGVIHFYCFSKEDGIKSVKRKISSVSKSLGKKAVFIEVQKVLPYGPGIWKYRIDFSV